MTFEEFLQNIFNQRWESKRKSGDNDQPEAAKESVYSWFREGWEWSALASKPLPSFATMWKEIGDGLDRTTARMVYIYLSKGAEG
jgi:hypothetical protein